MADNAVLSVSCPIDSVLRLGDLISSTTFPDCPDMYHSTACQSTRNPLESKVKALKKEDNSIMKKKKKKKAKKKMLPLLKTVVYQKDLVKQLHQPALDLLDGLELDLRLEDNTLRDDHLRFMSKVHPDWTAVDLPPVLNSEKDSEDRVMAVQLNPTIRYLQAATAKVVSHEYEPGSFYACSAPGNAYPLADALIYRDDEIKATVEVKTHNALHPSDGTEAGTFEDLLKVSGLGMKFCYPRAITCTTGEKIKLPQSSSQAKMFVQVWDHMHANNVDFAILTSYEVIYFFYKEGDTLYMSGDVSLSGKPLLNIFAFLACATGLVPRDKLKVPVPDMSWWPPSVNDPDSEEDHFGIHPLTLPSKSPQFQKQNKDKMTERAKQKSATTQPGRPKPPPMQPKASSMKQVGKDATQKALPRGRSARIAKFHEEETSSES